MRNGDLISGKRFASVSAAIRLLACVTGIALLVTASLQAQEPVGTVDVTFSALDQAVNTAANTLLEKSQLPKEKSPSQLISVSAFPGLLEASVPNRALIAQRPRAINRVETLRPALEPILRQEGIPPELVAVVVVESGGQTSALSRKGARGLWQLMPETARRYGLVVTPELDERLDIQKSTRAAAQYLSDLHSQFDDWRLTLAAYNAGENVVERALLAGRAFSYQSISSRLADETRTYVPAVLNAMWALQPPDLRTVQWPERGASTVYAMTTVEE